VHALYDPFASSKDHHPSGVPQLTVYDTKKPKTEAGSSTDFLLKRYQDSNDSTG
jgi:hypothetical protein